MENQVILLKVRISLESVSGVNGDCSEKKFCGTDDVLDLDASYIGMFHL